MKAMQPYRHVAHSSELQFQGLTSSFDELFIASRNASCAFGGVIYSNWNGGLKIQGWTLSNTCRLFDTASHVEVSRSRLQTFGGAMDDVDRGGGGKQGPVLNPSDACWGSPQFVDAEVRESD